MFNVMEVNTKESQWWDSRRSAGVIERGMYGEKGQEICLITEVNIFEVPGVVVPHAGICVGAVG